MLEGAMQLTHINLCLSNRCNASCIWCPSTRGTKHNYDMPFETVKKIVDELVASKAQIKMIHLSENGEALYNKDFLKIARYIKEHLPDTAINLLSNFGLMTPKIARSLLEEKLLSSIQVNIDGHDEESYRAVKGISFKSVIRNVKKFLALRAVIDPEFNFHINVMPAFEYVLTVDTFLKALPSNAKENVPFSSYEEVVKTLRKFVPNNVRISHSKSGLWAEGKLITSGAARPEVDMRQLDCPLIFRVENEAFIAPNGDWYPCCLDDNHDIVLGNVLESSLEEIYNSEKRKTFISNLKARKFKEIGYPCNTVVCCQTISINADNYKELTKQFKKGHTIFLQKKD